MQCTWCYEMRCMAWTKCKTNDNNPTTKENIISPLRKRQELELRIWKVVSGVLHTHTHPSTLLASLITAQLSPILNPLFTFLKTATIPTYYGISIAILRYIAMQLSTLPLLWHAPSFSYCFAWSCSWHRICGKATIHNSFIHVTHESLHIPVHRQRHSYRVILF